MGWDNSQMHVSWLTYDSTDWKESNPSQVFRGIVPNGSHTFDLAIRETQTNSETGEEEEIITDYLPQTVEQAHNLLMNLSTNEADFKSVDFEIVGITLENGEKLEPKEIVHFWKPDEKVIKGDKRNAFDGKEWVTYEAVQDQTTRPTDHPAISPSLWKVWNDPDEFSEWKQPLGAHDSYPKAAKVRHKDQNWISNIDNNVYEPGVYGWEMV